MLRFLLAILYGMLYVCPVSIDVPFLSCKRGWAKRRNNPFGVLVIVFFCHTSYCVLGAVPMVGRRSRLSVPWSLNTTLRKEGRPMGPATPRAFDSSGCLLFWYVLGNKEGFWSLVLAIWGIKLVSILSPFRS